MIDHIKNFDYEKFNNDEEDPDTVYVVEWHDTPKEPLGGWLCYNAKVIFVSHSIAVLNRKLRALDGVMSPSRVLEKVNVASSDASKSSNEIEGTKLEKKRNNSNVGSPLGDSDENFQLDCTVDDYELNTKTSNDNVLVILSARVEEDEVDFVHEQVSVNDGSESPTPLAVHDLDLQKIKIPKKTLSANKKQSDGSKASDKYDRPVPVPAYLEPQPSTSKCVEKRRTSSVTEKSDLESMKEIGKIGSGVFVTETQYHAARRSQSVSSMTTNLLLSVFPVDVLRESNCKGGAPKNAKDLTVRHKALDEDKIKAIKETVKRRFKAAFKESDFNKAINVKCTKLRNSDNDNKKPKNDKKEDGSEDPKL
ncbi:hypothetical protein KQX54_002194 [Cotesia glomerata]|uniref:BEN domain-containing protein n=1 Tax=Cotesia glomerata TaxID=32391 RepID=A0AAV7HU05_COTGL|nr:hypothetical protein KQX54_002194 [Cotesia glomerata]